MSSQPQVDLIAPRRILMDPELLKAARRGDKNHLQDLLARTGIPIADHNGDARSAQDGAANTGGIVVPNDNAPSPQEHRVSILLGVTIGGNTALHIAATLGHLEFAKFICEEESSLVMARNVMRETPLHCAARAGHHQIVGSIISFTSPDSNELGVEAVLRARNQDWGTALHEAVRNGHVEVAKLLMTADRGLANMVDEEGISPLYLAAMVGSLPLICAILSPPSTTIAAPPSTTTAEPPSTTTTAPPFTTTAAPPSTTTAPPPFPVSYAGPDGQMALHAAAFQQKSGSLPLIRAILSPSSTTTAPPPSTTIAAPPFPVSYAGPDGQTALHAAAFRQKLEIAQELLNSRLMPAEKADKSGSTALHYAVTAGNDKMVKLLLEHNTSLAYIKDSCGLFPVHVAAMRGKVSVINELIKHCLDSDELLDNRGGNFLHIAVQSRREAIVQYVCRRSELVKLMNARDSEGNTPLHLAVTKQDDRIVSLLIRNKTVNLSIMNKKGLTPRDLSIIRLDPGLHYAKNPSDWIDDCLAWVGAIRSPRRLDHFARDNLVPVDLEKERKKHAQLTRSLVISSVLIATVTFAAAFTLPGGYRSDGTPTLARRYVFKAFVIADTLAFIFSLLSTISSIFGGSQLVHHRLSLLHVVSATGLLVMASTSFVAAFALAIYLVLAPVNNSIAILVFVIPSCSLLSVQTPDIINISRHAITVKSRLGWTGLLNILVIILQWILSALFIYIFIFLLALI